MSEQHGSRSAIVLNTIGGKVSSVIGWILTAFFGLTLILILASDSKGKGSAVVFFSLIIAGGIALIVSGIKTKRRIKRFKQYVTIIGERSQSSIESIAAAVSQPVEFVMNDLYVMIGKKFFVNAHIDRNSREIIIGNRTTANAVPVQGNAEPESSFVVTCKGCGATNRIVAGRNEECEFCGSPISVK